MIDEQPSYYAVIPANVRYDKKLSPNEKLLFGEITTLCNKTGKCFASNRYFAELYEVEKETVSRWISHLDKQGYINSCIEYKENTKEIVNRYIQLNQYPIDKKINTPIDKKINDNNTSNNITRFNNKENKKEIGTELGQCPVLKEKESDISNIIESIENEKLKTTLKEFIKMRKSIKKPLTEYGLELIIKKLNKMSVNVDEQVQILEQSIENCWQGLFEVKKKETKQESDFERARRRLING